MPLIQISLIEGKSSEYIQAVADGVHHALQTAWAIPENERFQTIFEHKKSHFIINKTVFDGNRSEDVIVIYITAVMRTADLKTKLYQELVKVLAISPGVRKEDVFVSIVDNAPENWSFGKGIAQLLGNR